MFEGIVHPDVPRDHPVWGELLRAMCEKWIPGYDLTSLPEVCANYADDMRVPYSAFVRNHGITNEQLHAVIEATAQLTGGGRGATSSAAGVSGDAGADRANQRPDAKAGEEAGPRKKRRRGAPRNRPGASERRWAALEKAMD